MFEAKKAWEVLSKNGVTAPLCLEDLTRICASIGSELVSYKSGEVLGSFNSTAWTGTKYKV